MEIIYWDSLDKESKSIILARSQSDIASVSPTVEKILDGVRKRGDAACKAYTLEFDGTDLGDRSLAVSEDEFASAAEILPQSVKTALTKAIEQVRRFHRTQRNDRIEFIETAPGLYVAERATPVPSAGLYVPRGRGSFPSMLYMLALPARIAGVPELCVVTPPLSDGSVDPACLYAAELCGVRSVYRVGGAQAIGALAYGTETIPKVSKIVGPGNVYVSAAKRIVGVVVDVGLPAGPSESVIIADDSAKPWKIALDLTVEAEHGADSQALLITPSGELAERVLALIPELIDELPEPRRSFVDRVFAGYGGIVVVESMQAAIDLVNDIAPEHLSIRTEEPFAELSSIRHAGEILLGEHTPFSLANYAAGANAVLPTGATARTFSPVSVRDFVKHSSIVYATEKGLSGAAETVAALADYEGFPAHSRAVRRRSGE